MRQFVKWSFSIILVVASVLAVIYLPEYMALQKDKEYVNQYQLYEQETSDVAYMDLEFTEKMEILLLPVKAEGDTICVMQTEEPEVVLEINKNIYVELKKELERLEQMRLIPNVSEEFDMQQDMSRAELDALTSDAHPGKVLYVWTLTFEKEDEMAYTVTMDADTHKIYDFYVNGNVVKDYLEIYNGRMEKVGGEFYELYRNWFEDYANYLNYVDGDKEQKSETKIVELKWNGTGSFGQMQTGELPWNLHIYANFEERLFYFRMSNVYEYHMTNSSAY